MPNPLYTPFLYVRYVFVYAFAHNETNQSRVDVMYRVSAIHECPTEYWKLQLYTQHSVVAGPPIIHLKYQKVCMIRFECCQGSTFTLSRILIPFFYTWNSLCMFLYAAFTPAVFKSWKKNNHSIIPVWAWEWGIIFSNLLLSLEAALTICDRLPTWVNRIHHNFKMAIADVILMI